MHTESDLHIKHAEHGLSTNIDGNKMDDAVSVTTLSGAFSEKKDDRILIEISIKLFLEVDLLMSKQCLSGDEPY